MSLINELSIKPIKIFHFYSNFISGFYSYDIPILFISCILIYLIYQLIEPHCLSIKAKAWIVMLQSSFVLSLCGLIHVSNTIIYNKWQLDDIYTEHYLSRSIVIYFTASNIMDLLIGFKDYPKYMDPLSTIFHHIFYIFFMIVLLHHHYSTGFLLCFLMEIPTFILSLGTVNRNYRSDLAFGISFLLTRITFNAFLAYKLAIISFHGSIWKICLSVLCLHIYWFNKWFKVYGKKSFTLSTNLTTSSYASFSSIKDTDLPLVDDQ